MERARRRGRKLLVASLGVAAISYVGCSSSSSSTPAPTDGGGTDGSPDGIVANLVPPPHDAQFNDLVANLVQPPPDSSMNDMMMVANLVPPPVDGGIDGQGD